MANLQLINELLKDKKISKLDFCSKIGISDTSLRLIVERNSTKTDILEKIAKELNVPVGVFFDEQCEDVVNEDDRIDNLLREIGYLKDILTEKERTIQILMKQK